MFSCLSRLGLWLPQEKNVRETERSTNVFGASSLEAGNSKTPGARAARCPGPGRGRGRAPVPRSCARPVSLPSPPSPDASGSRPRGGLDGGPFRSPRVRPCRAGRLPGSLSSWASPGELGAGRRGDGGPETRLGPGSQQHRQNLKVAPSLHGNRSFFHLKWRSSKPFKLQKRRQVGGLSALMV